MSWWGITSFNSSWDHWRGGEGGGLLITDLFWKKLCKWVYMCLVVGRSEMWGGWGCKKTSYVGSWRRRPEVCPSVHSRFKNSQKNFTARSPSLWVIKTERALPSLLNVLKSWLCGLCWPEGTALWGQSTGHTWALAIYPITENLLSAKSLSFKGVCRDVTWSL